MKLSLLTLLFFATLYSNGQSISGTVIDTSNYYNYYSTGKNLKGTTLGISWLRLTDIVPILMEEMENAGHEWLSDYCLFKVDTGQYIVLAAYSRKSNFGFLYIEGHAIVPEKEHRINLTKKNDKGIDYTSVEQTPSGNPSYVKIKKMPQNVFVLNEDCYWYQATNNVEDNKILVTKRIILNILRQDIRKYLAKVPKVKE